MELYIYNSERELTGIQKKPPVPESTERSIDSLMERLDIIKQHI